MKYSQREVLELKVFNEDGQLITTLDTLKESEVVTGKENYLFVKDALLDRKLLEFIGTVEKNTNSDFERTLGNGKFNVSISFNEKLNKKCQVIARGVLRQSDTGIDFEYNIVVPNAVIKRNIRNTQSATVSSEFDIYFEKTKYNEAGDLYKMQFQN